MATFQPDHDPHVQDLHHYINKIRICTPERKGHFIPKSDLHAYSEDPYRVRRLLSLLCPDIGILPDPHNFWKMHSKVLSILLLLSKARFIKHFLQHSDLHDGRLPFNHQPGNFPIDSTDPQFFNNFNRIQWEFCSPTFHSNMDMRFESQEILPIIQQDKIGTGGSGTTYKIALHEAYNRLVTRQRHSPIPDGPYTSTFVLKRYEGPDAEKDFMNEVDGFKKLQPALPCPSIIRYYGSFTHVGTRNIILEYANGGNLEQYFEKVGQPTNDKDIIMFWDRLFRLFGALMAIHGVEWNDAEVPQIFQGWHQDLKPSNILVNFNSNSVHDCDFKIADLGLSHFKKKSSSQKEATDEDTRGTRSYGAPECYRFNDYMEHSPIRVRKQVDVWSLGCILSEAAAWVVKGWDGLQEYRRRRKLETDRIHGFKDTYCFHDGEDVLRAVQTMHDNLAEDCQTFDHVSAGQDMQNMILRMLAPYESRPEAIDLYHQGNKIIQQAKSKLPSGDFLPLDPPRSGQASLHARPRRQTPPVAPRGFPLFSHANSSYPYNNSSPTLHLREVADHESTNNDSYSSGFPFPVVPPLAPYHRNPDSPQVHVDDVASERLGFDGGSHKGYALGWSPRTTRDLSRDPMTKTPLQAAARSNQQQSYVRGNFFSDVTSQSRRRGLDRNVGIDAMNSTRAGTIGGFSQANREEQRTHHQPRLLTTGSYAQEVAQRKAPDILAPVPRTSHNPESPILQVKDLRRWRYQRKVNGKNTGEVLPHESLMQQLTKRDHVFLIDDSYSMRQHKTEVQDLFEQLTYLLKESDPDGIDMYYTMSDKTYKSKRSSKLMEALQSNEPPIGSSNIRIPMRRILESYQAKLKQQGLGRQGRRLSISRAAVQQSVRPLSLYILTDGVWQPGCDPADLIASLIKTLREHGYTREQFGIQFISFGNDFEGQWRLARLDSHLGLRMDIVDTERFDGNVWKMLLGPIHPWFDGDDHDGEIPVTDEQTCRSPSTATEITEDIQASRDLSYQRPLRSLRT